MLVPPLEVRVAAGLLINSVRETAGFIGAGLLVAYAAAMELNLLRGRRNLDCGCLGLRGRGVISAALVWRNLLMAAAVCIRSNARPWGWLDAGTTVAAVCALALLYAAVNGLLRLQARNRLRRG